MSELIEVAKAMTARSKDRLLLTFSYVPDDRLTWQPAPGAKPALSLVAHCSVGNRYIASLLRGDAPAFGTVEEAAAATRKAEAAVTTREQAVKELEDSTAALIDAIQCHAAARIDETVTFLHMPVPVRMLIMIASGHMGGHASQIDYLQTIWGDPVPHF